MFGVGRIGLGFQASVAFGVAAAKRSPRAAGPDEQFNNVGFLSNFDGINNATSANDSSNSGHSLVFNGDAKLDTGNKKFGSSSLRLSGAGDSVKMDRSL